MSTKISSKFSALHHIKLYLVVMLVITIGIGIFAYVNFGDEVSGGDKVVDEETGVVYIDNVGVNSLRVGGRTRQAVESAVAEFGGVVVAEGEASASEGIYTVIFDESNSIDRITEIKDALSEKEGVLTVDALVLSTIDGN